MNTSSHEARKKRRSQRGFALLMSVLAVAGLMVMLIGLLSMLTLERKTARSYSDAARADMALQSGLAEAIGTISPIANRDDTLVFRMEDTKAEIQTVSSNDKLLPPEHFFTFGAQYDTQSKEWRVSPFASGFKQITGGSNVPNTAAIKLAMQEYQAEEIAGVTLGNVAVPKASWVQLGEKGDTFQMRYAWWAEDLTGRIDGAYAGSETRQLGLDARELGLFTIFNPAAEKDGAGPEDALIAKREQLRSTASVRQILSEANAKMIEPYLTYELPREVNAAPLIPHGFGYPDAGKPALDLNDLIAKRDVEKIASHIDRNLPQWNSTRKGGFPSTENYTKTIAASIIDYADVDQDATIGAGYRGVDSYPFVNELYDRYTWVEITHSKLVIRVATYAELWNLTQQEIKGNFSLENINLHEIKIPPAAIHKFTPVTFPDKFVLIPANGFLVVFCGSKDYEFPLGAFAPGNELEFRDTYTSSYKLRWNQLEVDWARGGVRRTPGTLKYGDSARKWKGNASPAHDHSIGQHGDPRSSFYIRPTSNTLINGAPVDGYIHANDYDGNSNWGGRALKRTIASSKPFREVKLALWPDRGLDSTAGVAAGSDAKLPIGLPYPATQTSRAPAYISNKGSIQTTAELGNIFDPAQWSAVDALSGIPSAKAGGGYSLAIGRPEFTKYDKEGLRGAQLLDLFYAKTPQQAQISRININTAPREVLRTLVAGQDLSLDPATPHMYPPKQNIVGDRFADAVIASRQHAPLRSLSDLNLIRLKPDQPRNYTTPNRDTEPFFGSRLQYTTPPSDTWDDAGREELFQRVANMVTFQGKTFRVIVAGQVLDRSGKIIGQRTREITVRFEPKRDAQGLIDTTQPFVVRVLSERGL